MSKKLAFFIFIVSVVAVLVATAVQTSAAPIVPQVSAQPGSVEGGPLRACDLLTLYNNILRFGIYAATVIATLMLTYAGFLYITSSAKIGNIEKAHGIFTNVIIGFIIVLVAWLIVSTLLRVFTAQSNYNPFAAIQCNVETPTTTRNVTPAGFETQSYSDYPTGLPAGEVPVCLTADSDSNCTTYASIGLQDSTLLECQDPGATGEQYCCSMTNADGSCKLAVTVGPNGQPSYNNDVGENLYVNPNVGLTGVAPTEGICSPDALQSVWGDNAATAGCICASESGGGLYNGITGPRTDVMLIDQQQPDGFYPGFSACPFQLNVTSLPAQYGGCGAYTCNTNTQACMINGVLTPPNPTKCDTNVSAYEQTLGYKEGALSRNGGYCHVITNQPAFNSCVQNLLTPGGCAKGAQYLLANGGWAHWSTSAKKCRAI